MFVHILKRDYSEGIALPGAAIRVERMSWMALGGPDEALLAVEGSGEGLWELAELLRCPVEIYDDAGEAVWWGYVDKAEVQRQRIRVRIGLSGMANQVTVLYTNLVPGHDLIGTSKTTETAVDAVSRETYGAKSLRVSLGSASAAQAEAYRDTLLEARKYPIPEFGLADPVKDGKPGLGTLYLKGWWHTLDWTYFAQSNGRELNENGGTQDWLGAQTADTSYAQSFQLDGDVEFYIPEIDAEDLGGWEADRVQIRCKTIGAPTDNLVVELCSDNGGTPGAALTSGSLGGADIGVSTDMRLFEIPFNGRVGLLQEVTYWLVVRRSGAVDGMNYYMVDTELGGGSAYPRGALYVNNGAVWSAHSPDADLYFRLLGTKETSRQVYSMLYQHEFFSAVDLRVSSGVYTAQYRSGSNRTRTEVEALLSSGTVNKRRMLAAVDACRRVRVYVAPAPGECDGYLFAGGEIRDAYDQPVHPERGVAGTWLRLRDVVPGTADVTRLADMSRIFVEKSVWRADTVALEIEQQAS